MDQKNNHTPIILVMLLVLVTVAPYLQVGGFGFVNYDDPYYVTDNPVVKAGLTWAGTQQVWGMAHPYPMPLAYLTFMTEVEFFGLNPAAFHGVGVAGHLLNVLLFLGVVWRLTRQPVVAALAAAWFAVHPLRVEAVVWISEQKEIGAALFGLLAIHAYLSAIRQPSTGKNHYRTMAVLAHLASMLYKPQWVTLPLLLLLLDWWPLQRRGLGNLVREKAGFLAVSAFFSVLTLFSFGSQGRLTGIDTLPIMQRFANGVAAYGGFIGKTLWPTELAVYYPLAAHETFLITLLWIACLALVTLLCFLARKQRPWLLMAWGWFLVALLPVSGVFAGGELIVRADRWSYLPHMGLMMGLAWQYMALAPALPPMAWRGGAVATIVVLATLTWQQVAVWQNSQTLWQQVLAIPESQHSYYPRILLGKHYLEQHRPDLALPLFQQARDSAPHNPMVALELANLLAALDRMDEAWPYYVAMANLAASTPKLITQTALAFLLNHRDKEAAHLSQVVVKRWSTSPDPFVMQSRFLLALALETLGQHPQSKEMLHSFLWDPAVAPGNRCRDALGAFGDERYGKRFPDSLAYVRQSCQ